MLLLELVLIPSLIDDEDEGGRILLFVSVGDDVFTVTVDWFFSSSTFSFSIIAIASLLSLRHDDRELDNIICVTTVLWYTYKYVSLNSTRLFFVTLLTIGINNSCFSSLLNREFVCSIRLVEHYSSTFTKSPSRHQHFISLSGPLEYELVLEIGLVYLEKKIIFQI